MLTIVIGFYNGVHLWSCFEYKATLNLCDLSNLANYISTVKSTYNSLPAIYRRLAAILDAMLDFKVSWWP